MGYAVILLLLLCLFVCEVHIPVIISIYNTYAYNFVIDTRQPTSQCLADVSIHRVLYIDPSIYTRSLTGLKTKSVVRDASTPKNLRPANDVVWTCFHRHAFALTSPVRRERGPAIARTKLIQVTLARLILFGQG